MQQQTKLEILAKFGAKISTKYKIRQSFYAYVRSKQNVRDKVGPLVDNAGNIITQGCLMAEELNMDFSSVFTREDTSSIPVPETKFKGSEGERLGQLVVTPEVVVSKINNTSRVPVGGKSSVCLICMKYRIIILIIIIKRLGKILFSYIAHTSRTHTPLPLCGYGPGL